MHCEGVRAFSAWLSQFRTQRRTALSGLEGRGQLTGADEAHGSKPRVAPMPELHTSSSSSTSPHLRRRMDTHRHSNRPAGTRFHDPYWCQDGVTDAETPPLLSGGVRAILASPSTGRYTGLRRGGEGGLCPRKGVGSVTKADQHLDGTEERHESGGVHEVHRGRDEFLGRRDPGDLQRPEPDEGGLQLTAATECETHGTGLSAQSGEGQPTVYSLGPP